MSDSSIIQSNPQIMGGTPVFAGTRVPVKALWDYLEADKPLDEFLDHFPSVTRQQALAVLERAKKNWGQMRVLFDECVPRPFRKELPGHEVRTVTEMGWRGKTNGELLKVMRAEGFTVSITVDQNIPFQQNLRNATVAVVVLVATDNTLDALRPLATELLTVLSDPKPGQVVRIGD